MLLRKPAPEPAFYVTGGTLRSDAACYVLRRADDDLYESLIRGRFCYVLTPRQMGKSSLMIRTAARLRAEGGGVAILDLTAAGQHLSVEQWYGGLLTQMGSQLSLPGLPNLEDELLDFWEERKLLSPLQRWMAALREIVLPRYANGLTVFIDEIDTVRSLPFSTDEFFAGIRKLYNRRARDASLERLTFCLLGVATPSDLISDTQATPFNIGRRIELHDFTEQEAEPLAQGLNRDDATNERLLKRVLYWTNGHPYLTQFLCQNVAENGEIKRVRDVDRLCAELFLSPRAREIDANLLFVRDRLLRSQPDLAALLELYNRVHRGDKVNDDETSPLLSALKLSGVTRVAEGRLMVRNRIYAHAFDQDWIKANMPEAELRRQQRAFRRGMMRATAVILTILLSFAALILFTIQQRENQESARRQLLYAAHMNIAAQDWEASNIARLQELLITHLPAGREDLRGFEWYYFWRLLHRERQTLRHTSRVLSAAFSPDGKLLATGDEGFSIKLWNVTDGKQLAELSGHRERIWRLAFSPDGKRLASASWDHTVKIWDVDSRSELLTIEAHQDRVCGLAFSPDGQTLATGGWDHKVKLWEAGTGKLVRIVGEHKDWVWDVKFSPDGSKLASAGEDRMVKLWNARTGQETVELTGYDASVYTVAFSPDGSRLASGSNSGQIILWDSRNGRNVATLGEHSFSVNAVEFSRDGQRLVSAGADRVVRLWRLPKGGSPQQYAQLKSHSDEIRAATFSPDGRMLATGGDDSIGKLWDVPQDEKPDKLTLPNGQTQSLSFAPDGKRLAVANNRTIFFLDAVTGAALSEIPTQAVISGLAFSPDGRLIAAAHRDSSVTLWVAASGHLLDSLKGHSGVVTSLAFTPDSKFLVTSSRDHSVKLWDVANCREVFSFVAHSAGVKAVAISPDGKFLVTGSDDKTAIVWDLKTRKSKATLREHINEVWAVAFLPDGNRVATGSQDRSIKIWDWQNSRALLTLRGHAVGVRSLVFSPDGKRLASGDESGTIKLWDLVQGTELVTLNGHKQRVTALAFSPDGRTLASISLDCSVRFWRAASKDEVARQLAMTGR